METAAASETALPNASVMTALPSMKSVMPSSAAERKVYEPAVAIFSKPVKVAPDCAPELAMRAGRVPQPPSARDATVPLPT